MALAPWAGLLDSPAAWSVQAGLGVWPWFRRAGRAALLLSLVFLCCWVALTWRDAWLGRASWWHLLAGAVVSGLWLGQFPRLWVDLGRRSELNLVWSARTQSERDADTTPEPAGWFVNVNGMRPVEVIPVLNIGPVLLLRMSALKPVAAWSEWLWLSPWQSLDAQRLHHLRALVFVSGMNRQASGGDIRSPYKASSTKVASCPTMSSRDNGSKRPSPQSRRA